MVCQLYLNKAVKKKKKEFTWWLSGKESSCQSRGQGFDPWSRKIPRAVKQLSP